MSDLHNAGGMPALLQVLRPLLHLSAKTITGQTLGELLDASQLEWTLYEQQIVGPLSEPLYPSSSLTVFRGNLAPDGAVIQAPASKNQHLSHTLCV